ncbi:MAG: hypothetical protein AAF862_14935, partial [Pseudomonadota bacterium]
MLDRLLRFTKSAFQRLPTDLDTILVASFGRAGSTLVFEAVSKALAAQRFFLPQSFSKRLVRDHDTFFLSMGSLKRGVVYKTHDYPSSLNGNLDRVKAIFLFGSAVDAALSVYQQKQTHGEDWIKLHFQHLRQPYRFNDLFKEDVLGLEEQCRAWMTCTSIPVLCMRYETLWTSTDALSQFCGTTIELPEKRARKPKHINADLLKLANSI